ncbi:hypothetical protein IE53DRAFT_385367 [Violaceomyces palustris]|uniref:Uncharacterized protein n=1 Tax=Violaceomyces palustris TaxID=1673888 RepID=A0ACD0P2H7_9BASI|nr:hypothetical protein IE53DRAFT_385367 [Violaceomyces palustris]
MDTGWIRILSLSLSPSLAFARASAHLEWVDALFEFDSLQSGSIPLPPSRSPSPSPLLRPARSLPSSTIDHPFRKGL